MTLHITTITQNHIISVSDRLISTSRGFIELDKDHYKHLILTTPGAKVVITFAGLAGLADSSNKIKESILDKITSILGVTSSEGKHQILVHLSDVKKNIEEHFRRLKTQGLLYRNLRLVIAIWGFLGTKEHGPLQYGCFIDNCLDEQFKWLSEARGNFYMRHKFFLKRELKKGCIIHFLGNELLAARQRPLIRLLKIYAKKEEPIKVFETAVKIIRAVQLHSNGTVGYNCSGIRITKDSPGMEVYDDRDYTEWEVVMPNCIRSSPRMSMVVSNMKGKRGV